MKKKNLFRTAALLAVASVSFAGCGEGDDVKGGDSSVAGVVKATVQDPPDNEKVDAVRLSDGSYEAATGTYKDGSLEFTLPPTVSGDHLSVLEVGRDLPPGITPSPADAKMYGADYIYAYKNGSQVGEFVYGSKSGSTQIKTTFAYVDKDVTITGSSGTITFDITAKQGWNKIYEITTSGTKITTKDPGGLTWTFDDWYGDGGSDSSFDGAIQATVVNPPSNATVDVVKAVVRDGDGQEHPIADGEYKDGSFSLTLPTNGLDAYLEPVFDGAPEGITVSSPDVKGISCNFYAYNDGSQVGYFWYDGYGSANIDAGFMYVDRDVSITGSASGRRYNVSLKRGWNKMYDIEGRNPEELTTTDPGGLKWSFRSNN